MFHENRSTEIEGEVICKQPIPQILLDDFCKDVYLVWTFLHTWSLLQNTSLEFE